MYHYLVAYDVSKPSRRRKIAKSVYAHALGGQKSALEAPLSDREADRLAQELFIKLDARTDKVNIIRVDPKAILLGRATQLNYNDGVIFI